MVIRRDISPTLVNAARRHVKTLRSRGVGRPEIVDVQGMNWTRNLRKASPQVPRRLDLWNSTVVQA